MVGFEYMAKKTLKKLPELSIFFPAYNEAGNIEEVVHQALHIAPVVAHKYEIVIINDGSKDATRSISKRLEAQYHPFVRLVSQTNRGYGGALKRGFRETKYEWIFFTDSDLQFDINELSKFVRNVHQNDLVIGYRRKRVEGWKRDMLAKMLKLWNRFWLGFPREIRDIDCAFKLIHRNVFKSISPLYSDGAMISTEFLLKAYLAGFKFRQLGVHHYERRIGKPTGNNLKVIFKAVRDTFVLMRIVRQHPPVSKEKVIEIQEG